jgi:hypothetical protein
MGDIEERKEGGRKNEGRGCGRKKMNANEIEKICQRLRRCDDSRVGRCPSYL